MRMAKRKLREEKALLFEFDGLKMLIPISTAHRAPRWSSNPYPQRSYCDLFSSQNRTFNRVCSYRERADELGEDSLLVDWKHQLHYYDCPRWESVELLRYVEGRTCVRSAYM